jgi:predicted permease
MFKNYLVIAFRNLLRKKSFSAINISGLAVGIAACLLIFLVVEFENSFDTFHKKRDRIYRVVTQYNTPDGEVYSCGAPVPVTETMRADFPQLENAGIIIGGQSGLVTITDPGGKAPTKKFEEGESVFIADPQFFQIFDFKWLAGDPKTALNEPNSGLLTKETAERYFGDWRTAIGKTIRQNNRRVITITGVLDNIPVNSDFPLKVVMSYASLKGSSGDYLTNWENTNGSTQSYVVLPQNVSPATINAALAAVVKKYKPAAYANQGLRLQPLSDIHFDRRFGNFSGRHFSRELITVLMLVGIFLLVIACVNFINLATAQAVNRAREVGVRKVLGSSRKQLAMQFIGETALITFCALLLALVIAALALPFLSKLLGVQLSFALNSTMLLFLFGVFVGVTLISGSYPALVLSGFNPINALKSKVAPRIAGGISLRRALVVLQFCIAQILIIGMLVVVSQMAYFKNTDLGFDKDAIVAMQVPGDSLSKTKYQYLREQLLAQAGITSVSYSFAMPADNANWSSDFKFDHSTKTTDWEASFKWADTAYFKHFDLQFVAGRPYFNSDTVSEFVVNETLVKKLGFSKPEDILGKELNFWDGKKVAPVVGVIKDYHAASLRDPIPPLVMGAWKQVYGKMSVKIQPQRVPETLSFIEKAWTQAFPENVYAHEFLDERIANFYKQESQLSKLYKIFAGIAIFISCLGLYGLVSFMAVQRNKEVGIRKVLGASIQGIVYLFSKEFTVLIALAFLIAAPVAYYFMHQWLANFTFRIPLSWTLFAAAGLSSVVIAWIAVGYKAISAAIANPVKSLRTE